MLGCGVRCRGGEGRDAGYQAVDVLGLQVGGSHNVHPNHALLREVLFLRPKRELARGLGSFRVLRKGVDAELALCVCQGGKVLATSLAAAAWLLTPSRRGPGSLVGRWVVLRMAGPETHKARWEQVCRAAQPGPRCSGGVIRKGIQRVLMRELGSWFLLKELSFHPHPPLQVRTSFQKLLSLSGD